MQFEPFVPIAVIAAGVCLTIGVAVVRVRRQAPASAVARTMAMVLLAAVIALDPTVAGGRSTARTAAVDVLFVVDTTSSMAALDHDGDSPRLHGVRADIVDLAERFPGAHFSVVRFDSQAHLELPWTTDVGALETAVAVLRQERAAFSTGSELALPVGLIDLQLPRSSAGNDGAGGHSVVFYFSDGEERTGRSGSRPQTTDLTARVLGGDDRRGGRATSFAELAGDIDGGAVFGYGTAAGAPMPYFMGPEELITTEDAPFVRDHAADAPAISRLDEGNLRDIADQLAVPYLHRGEPGGLARLAASILADAPVADDGSREARQRLYWIPALALFALALWQGAVTAAEALATSRLFGATRRGSLRTPVTASAARQRQPGDEAAA